MPIDLTGWKPRDRSVVSSLALGPFINQLQEKQPIIAQALQAVQISVNKTDERLRTLQDSIAPFMQRDQRGFVDFVAGRVKVEAINKTITTIGAFPTIEVSGVGVRQGILVTGPTSYSSPTDDQTVIGGGSIVIGSRAALEGGIELFSSAGYATIHSTNFWVQSPLGTHPSARLLQTGLQVVGALPGPIADVASPDATQVVINLTDGSGNLSFAYSSLDKFIFLRNRAGDPSTPSNGGRLYTKSGGLYFIGSSGTVTPVAPA